MTSTVWPINSVSGAPTYAGRNLRQAQMAPLLAGATASRPLGAFSGVRPGTPASTVTVTSSTVYSVAAFAGVIDGEAANEAGPYGFSFDAIQTGTITAASSSNPRVDILFVQVSDPSESDGSSTPGVAVGYLAGTAAATPAAPAAPTGTFVIAQLNVPKSGGGNPTATWVAPYATAPGGVLPVATYAALVTTAGWVGQHATVYADQTASNNGLWEFVGATSGAWAGSNGWVPIGGGAQVVSSLNSVASAWTVQAGSKVARTGNLVTCHLYLVRSGNIPKGSPILTLEAAFRPPVPIRPVASLITLNNEGLCYLSLTSDGALGTGNYVSTTTSQGLDAEFSYLVS